MERLSISTHLFIMAVLLGAFLAMSDAATKCPKAGEFCGGIAGIQCCEGYDCILDSQEIADSGGVCKKRSCQKFGEDCGGFVITPRQCCKGLKCVLTNPEIADIGGTCQHSY